MCIRDSIIGNDHSDDDSDDSEDDSDDKMIPAKPQLKKGRFYRTLIEYPQIM